VFELFANNYGWNKEYILDNLTYPQMQLYLAKFGKRISFMLDLVFGGLKGDKDSNGVATQKKEAQPINAGSARGFGIAIEKVKKVEGNGESK